LSTGEDGAPEVSKQPVEHEGKRLSTPYLQKQITRQASTDKQGRRRTLGSPLSPGLSANCSHFMCLCKWSCGWCRLV